MYQYRKIIGGLALTIIMIVTVSTIITHLLQEEAYPNFQQGEPIDNVSFTYFNGAGAAADISTNETVIGKILEEQTGVNFEIEHLVGDLDTKIGMMIASNKYPDVIIPDAAIDKVLSANGLIDLKDLINEHGPNIKRVYERYFPQLENENGEIFLLPFFHVYGDYTPDPYIEQGAFWIQRRVLKEAGYPQVRTLDQYFELIRDYVNNHPEENLTGFITLTHDWRFFTTTNVPMHLAGYPNDGEVIVNIRTHEAKVYATSDYEYRYLKQLNQLNAEGLFDKASFIDNYEQYLAKLTSGKVLGMFDYAWQFGSAQRALNIAAKMNPENDDYVYFPLPITFDGQRDQYLDPNNFVRNRGIGITVSCKDPVRIIQYFDNLLKEENQILKSWGLVGETYEIDENGRFYRTSEQVLKMNESYRSKFGFTYYDWNWPQYGRYSTFSDGNATTPDMQPEVFAMSLTEADKKILDMYGVSTFTEMFAPPEERPWFPAWSVSKEQGSVAQVYESKKIELARYHYPQLVLGDPSLFEQNWSAYVEAFKQLDTKGYEAYMTSEIKKLVEFANQDSSS